MPKSYYKHKQATFVLYPMTTTKYLKIDRIQVYFYTLIL